ncbi:MAG: hypothetical protein ACYCWK_00035 [Cuniculiplasma sp.]
MGVAILSVELLLSSTLWSVAINDGLRQSYDYEFWKTFDPKLISLHSTILGLMPYIFMVTAIYSAIFLMSSKRGSASETLLKCSTGILAFCISILFLNSISSFVQVLSNAILSLSSSWTSVFSITYMISNIGAFTSSRSIVLEIAFDGIYLTSAFAMASFLMLRIAILISLYILLPVFSTLIGIDFLRSIIIKLWILYFQLLLSPLIILFIIYFYMNFTGYFFIQLGFLSLLTILPSSFIYSAYRLNQSKAGLFSGFYFLSGYSLLSFGASRSMEFGKEKIRERKESSRRQHPELFMPNLLQKRERDEDFYE